MGLAGQERGSYGHKSSAITIMVGLRILNFIHSPEFAVQEVYLQSVDSFMEQTPMF